MKRPDVVALAAGVLFGLGLVVSGMTDPVKVVGFLDVGGAWDPSLAFVMVGAIGVHMLLGRLVRRRRSPLFDAAFHLPARKDVDVRLIAGAVIFGVGWGLGGFCPGPAIVSAGSGSLSAVVFVAAMALGIGLEQALGARVAARGGATVTAADQEPCG